MKQLLLWFLLQTSIQSYGTFEIYNYEFKRGEASPYHDKEKALNLVRAKGTIYSDSFAQLPDAIKELNIEQSHFEQIEDGAFCSHPFEKITIYASHLPTLTKKMLGNCPSLKYFHFSNANNSTGDVNFAPDMFSGLPNLKTLSIHDAWKFPHMTKKFVESSTALEDFQLVHSNLNRIEAEAFDNLVNLEVLELGDTKLESVDGLWSTLKSLFLIRVVRSNLKSFPWNELRSLSNVKYIELARNKIESFDGNVVVESVPGLVNVTFWGNQVPCEKVQQEIRIIHKSLPQVSVYAETC